MKPQYLIQEFNNAKSREKLPFKCTHCEKTFFVAKHIIQARLKSKRNAKSIQFCSPKCVKNHKTTSINTFCGQCRLPIIKSQKSKRRSKSGNVFCSRSCSSKWGQAHKTKGTRISKLEIWLAKQLSNLYPNLEFHFNRRDAINGELDIYIPSLRLAFELNGIFHYEAIHGVDKLANIQSNDTRKFQACIERGIDLCILDISSIKHFKEHRAQPFLDIIVKIINQKT